MTRPVPGPHEPARRDDAGRRPGSADPAPPSLLAASLAARAPGADHRFGYPVPRISFTHIHKTGGGTLKRVLRQFYAPSEIAASHREDEDDASQDELRRRARAAAEAGVRLFDTHLDHAAGLGDEWSRIVLTRQARSRLRSNLNATLGARFETASPDPQADRAALLDGGLTDLVERSDPFSANLRRRSLNALAREFLQDRFMTERGLGAYDARHAREHDSALAALGEEAFAAQVEEHLRAFAFVGCLEEFDLSVAMLMERLRLPAQPAVASVHRKAPEVRDMAQRIVDSLPAEGLERLTGRDRIVDALLRRRFEADRERFLARAGGAGGVERFVSEAFERAFRTHVEGHPGQAVDGFVLRPGEPCLGWGFGVWRAAAASAPAFLVEEGSGCGLHAAMVAHGRGAVGLLGRPALARLAREGALTVHVNGSAGLYAGEARPDGTADGPLSWLIFDYALDRSMGTGAPAVLRIELCHRQGTGGPARIHAFGAQAAL